MTALLDTNVILDVLLDRSPFVGDSGSIWKLCDEGRFEGYIAAFTVPTIYYVVRRTRDRDTALKAVDQCLDAFEIAPVYRESLQAARRMAGSDFEDDLQVACAITSLLDCIVTRDPRGFADSPVQVCSPAEFLKQI